MDYPISRREFLKTSGIVAGFLTIGSISSGCASSAAFDFNTTRSVSYPKLKGHKIQSPEHYGLEGCYTGIWIGNSQLVMHFKSTIRDYEVKAGKKPTFVHIPYRPISTYYQGTSIDSVIYERNRSFKLIEKIGDMGIIPFITYDMRLGQSNKSGHTDVPEGKFDEEITVTAQWLKKYGELHGGFFIRTMREMNSGFWPWSNSRYFKKAWRHIWTIFDQEGTNKYATWVLHFTTTKSDYFSMGPYFLEDEFYDWISLTVYNYGPQLDGNYSFSRKIRPFYIYLRRNHPNKPIMVGETGCNKMYNRDSWINNLFMDIKHEYRGLRGVSLWNDRWDTTRMIMDNNILGVQKDLKAYREGLSDPYFIGAIGDLL